MAEVKWTPQALDDLEAICLFIARDAPPVAAVFAQRAFDVTDRLANFPESGRIVPEMNDPNFREILGNYRLIYRLRSGDVQIVTIHHGARQLNPAELEGGASKRCSRQAARNVGGARQVVFARLAAER